MCGGVYCASSCVFIEREVCYCSSKYNSEGFLLHVGWKEEEICLEFYMCAKVNSQKNTAIRRVDPPIAMPRSSEAALEEIFRRCVFGEISLLKRSRLESVYYCSTYYKAVRSKQGKGWKEEEICLEFYMYLEMA